jgi:hypothetical protein
MITISGTQYLTPDDILRTLIAWQLIGRSVDELHELAEEWKGNVNAPLPGDRRYARAMVAAANGHARDHQGGQADNGDDKPLKITHRGDLQRFLEAAQFGLESADDPEQWD